MIAADTASQPRSHLLPFIVAATFFMEYLDTTIIATALPQMARSFDVGPNEVSLGMTAYMLTLAVFIPVSGWIADRFGSRTVFALAVVIFTCASVLCGMSNGISWFTAARVLQGMGGALMVPVGRMIVVRNTDKSRLMQALSTITWPGIVAPVIGPTAGGFITTYASWRWSFFLNVPFGILALAAILWVVPNQRSNEKRPLDAVGFVLSGLALTSIMYGTELASHQDASVALAFELIVSGVLLGALALYHMARLPHPLLHTSPLGRQTFSAAVLWGSATRIGTESVPYLAPLLFQIGFGLSAFHSGLLLISSAVGNLGMKMFTTPILRRFGFRPVAMFNGLAIVAFVALCSWLGPLTPIPIILLVLFCYGLARSLQFTTLATLAYADVAESEKGSASVLYSVAQQMTIGMGIAFGAVCLRVAASIHQPHDGLPANPSRAFLVADFHWAFLLAAALVLLSLIGYVRLPLTAGDSLGGGANRKSKAAST
jgi:EmrB/QacA subfamily drug resistance transporter